MSEVIYKFPLQPLGETAVTVLTLPSGALLRAAAMQHGQLCLWMQVNRNNAPQARTFQVVGTGQPIPGNANFIATVQDGSFVWHVFEILPPTQRTP